MAKPKNPSNGTTKVIKRLKKQGKGELCPPEIGFGRVPMPKPMNSIDDILEEQLRCYALVFEGKLAIGDYTKLMYGLTQYIQGIKAKIEFDVLDEAYTKQWQGVRIIAPSDASVPDPMQQAIEGEILRDE